LNAYDGLVIANAATVAAGSNGQVSVFVTDDTDLIIDIDGYFAMPNNVNHGRTPVTNYFSGGQPQTVTVNWAFPFPDTNYTVTCNTVGTALYSFPILQVSAVNPSSVSVSLTGGDAPNAMNFTINCIGVHD
jgi:hypothetical protein